MECISTSTIINNDQAQEYIQQTLKKRGKKNPFLCGDRSR